MPGAVARVFFARADVDVAGDAAGLELGGEGGGCGEEGGEREGEGGVLHGSWCVGLFVVHMVICFCIPWYGGIERGILDGEGNIEQCY